jgi:hypothetical protein
MSIEFACQCGKKHRAADEHAGKRAKCKHCGQIAVIPGAKAEAAKTASRPTPLAASAPKNIVPAAAPRAVIPSGADDLLSAELPLAQPAALAPKPSTPRTTAAAPVPSGGRRCPSCQNQLSAVAVLCINCGYNLNTGKKTPTAPVTEIETPKKRPRSRLVQILVDRITSWKLWGGLGMMLLGVILFFCLMPQMDRFSPRTCRGIGVAVLLFMAGGFSFINGLCDGDNA